MKKTLFVIFLITLSLQGVRAQEIIKKEFYKDSYNKTKNEKKAEFVELTIKEKDGSLTRQTRNIASNKVIKSYNQDNVQNGVWMLANGDSLNYDFDVIYGNKEYPTVVKFDLNKNQVSSQVSGKFESPILQIYDNDVKKLLMKNLRYPVVAQENNEQGKVISQFILDENGKIKDYRIIQSASKVLDKEAERVLLRTEGYWTPAKIDGVPIKTLITVWTIYILQ